ncbi:MAG: iron ABC transporter permease [Verrucomicrobiae bacterium]|nr:iron ABC transporter permease [Verrucomicrobiae bacterium]
MKPRALTLLLAIALFGAAGGTLLLGSVRMPPSEVLMRAWRTMTGHSGWDARDRVLFEIRLPRMVAAASVGTILALAGLASQTLFRNPLATPSVMGVSNGAALGAVATMLVAGARGWDGIVVPIGGFLGGFGAVTVVFALGKRGAFFGHSLLLAGIAIAALCSAMTTGMLYLAGERLQAIVFWLMGGLWQAGGHMALVLLGVALGLLFSLLALARPLNVLLAGETAARDLGVDVPHLQRKLLLLIALASAVAVSLTGVIGFIGLIVPHLLRLVIGGDHRRLIPTTALGGALLLLMADTLVRTLAAPAEIPVGILTAMLGAPVFLWLLRRRDVSGCPS